MLPKTSQWLALVGAAILTTTAALAQSADNRDNTVKGGPASAETDGFRSQFQVQFCSAKNP